MFALRSTTKNNNSEPTLQNASPIVLTKIDNVNRVIM